MPKKIIKKKKAPKSEFDVLYNAVDKLFHAFHGSKEFRSGKPRMVTAHGLIFRMSEEMKKERAVRLRQGL